MRKEWQTPWDLDSKIVRRDAQFSRGLRSRNRSETSWLRAPHTSWTPRPPQSCNGFWTMSSAGNFLDQLLESKEDQRRIKGLAISSSHSSRRICWCSVASIVHVLFSSLKDKDGWKGKVSCITVLIYWIMQDCWCDMHFDFFDSATSRSAHT
jgi:hypothetical protein